MVLMLMLRVNYNINCAQNSISNSALSEPNQSIYLFSTLDPGGSEAVLVSVHLLLKGLPYNTKK